MHAETRGMCVKTHACIYINRKNCTFGGKWCKLSMLLRMEVLTSTHHLINYRKNEESDQYLVTNICLLKWHQFVKIILEK